MTLGEPSAVLGSGGLDSSDPLAAELLSHLEANCGSIDVAIDVAKAAVSLGWYELAISLLAPEWATEPFAEWHRQILQWAASLQPGVKPQPLVVCAPRGAGKSTVLSLVVALAAASGSRSYAMWVSNTARQTEDAVSGVGELLAAPLFAATFPGLATQYRNELGRARDWTKHRIRTEAGFTLDGIGLDQSMRGARVGSARPDLLIFDDIEDAEDSIGTTNKKRRIMADSLIPAGAEDLAIVYVQNLIHPPGSDGIMVELVEGRSEMLSNACVIGPIPMVKDLVLTERTPTEADPRRYVIAGGEPTWQGQSLEFAEGALNETGLSSFLRERQHEDVPREGGLFDPDHWLKGELKDLAQSDVVAACRSWDIAFSRDRGDWTVGVLMAFDKHARPMILHIERFQLDSASVLDRIEQTIDVDNRMLGRLVPVVIEEMPAAGKAFRQQVEARLAGNPLSFERPLSSKTERALAFATEVQRGRALLFNDVRSRSHNAAMASFIREAAGFPHGRHDDQVDAATQAFNWLHGARKHRGRIGTAGARMNTSW